MCPIKGKILSQCKAFALYQEEQSRAGSSKELKRRRKKITAEASSDCYQVFFLKLGSGAEFTEAGTSGTRQRLITHTFSRF